MEREELWLAFLLVSLFLECSIGLKPLKIVEIVCEWASRLYCNTICYMSNSKLRLHFNFEDGHI
jgi:hypothetical protein